jgi:hypothetical protein
LHILEHPRALTFAERFGQAEVVGIFATRIFKAFEVELIA